MKDKLLRTLADMENLRERTARTAAETKQYAVQVRGLACLSRRRRCSGAAGAAGSACLGTGGLSVGLVCRPACRCRHPCCLSNIKMPQAGCLGSPAHR